MSYRFSRRLTPWRLGIDPNPVHLNFLLDKSGSGTCFSPNAEGFPCQYHSTYLSYAPLSKDCNYRTNGRSLVRLFRQSTDLSDIWGRQKNNFPFFRL
jgi:hypothetical protein